MSRTEITPEQWRTLIGETDRATFGELVDAVDDSMIDTDPEAAVERATGEGGCLVADDEASGMFDVFVVDDGADCLVADDESADGLGASTNNENQQQTSDSDNEDTDSNDATLGFETREPDSSTDESSENAERSLEAFEAAVEFFHAQVDADLSVLECVEYDTPREAYREGRGWSDATIDMKKLGWAPASGNALLDHLMRSGFDREAILGTGLFWDNLSPIWKGRFVLPYFDSEGRPTFAISRRVGDGHPADRAGDYSDDGEPADPAKYHKVPVSALDECVLEEPIYGVETVDAEDADGPVLITEGIADAITAHQAGYRCISPVTTSFKIADRRRLAELLDDAGVSTAFVVNDAEPPTSSLRDDDRDGWDRLHIEQFGEGVSGAVRTASHLTEDGIDARIAELPQPAAEKVDLDDYLARWGGDLRPVLAGAKRVEDHAAYDRTQQAIQAARESASFEREEDSDGGNGSALYDIGIRKVTGVNWGYRGPNPLGHHGESENYFTLIEDLGLAYDHKYKKAYTPLTYLLCEAGERDAARPNGRLDDEEILAAWVHAKQEGILAADDPIPRRALRHVARESTGWDGELVEHETYEGERFEGLPSEVYNAALDAVEESHGVDHGRRRSGGSNGAGNRDAVAPIPTAKLDALSDDARLRAARKRGLDIPSTREARERLRNTIMREMGAANGTVIDAPTALGKSYGVATEPWIRQTSTTGGQPVIQFSETREARDDAAQATSESMATGAVLYGRKEASPLARGDHDPQPEEEDPELVVTIDGLPASEWFDEMCDNRGLPFSTALAIAKERNDQGLDDLPPFGQEDPAVAQWEDLPRTDEGDPTVDVIHATHQFAHVPSLRTATNVVLDEQPDYREEISQDRIRRMVNAYLKKIGAPVTDFERFVSLAELPSNQYRTDAAAERDQLDELLDPDGDTPDPEWYVDNRDAHALAPAVTRAVWNAIRWEEADRNGRQSSRAYHEPPRFDAEQGSYNAGTWVSVVVDEDHTIRTVRSTPDFTQARSVIGLDAHPSMPLWQLNAAPGMDFDTVLDPTERRLWRRYERGLQVVQIGDATRPRSGENALEWMNEDRVRAILNRIRDEYGSGFKTALSTVQTERQLKELLREVGIENPETMHFGEEKSRNDFADEQAGYVYGCMDPGDGFVLDTLAELGLDATPETAETDEGETVRAKGRGFEGDDDEKAAAVLASVRENHVAQAAGRYARNADTDHGATVYLHTDAAPTGFVDAETPGVEWLPTEMQREIVDELASRPSATVREIADAVDCSKEHARETLKRLTDRETPLVTRREQAGEHGADVFDAEGGGDIQAEIGDTTNTCLWDSNRWSLAVWLLHTADETDTTPPTDQPASTEGVVSGDWPPDPGD